MKTELRQLKLQDGAEHLEGARKTLAQAGASTLEDVLRLLECRDAATGVRVNAAWLLGALRFKPALPVLKRAFLENGAELSWECAKALSKFGGGAVGRFFTDALANNGSNHRWKAEASAWALGTMGFTPAVSRLSEVLVNERAPLRLRVEAAEALGNIGSKRALPALLKASRDKRPDVRFWVAYALGRIPGRPSAERLQQLREDRSTAPGWGAVAQEAGLSIEVLQKMGSNNSGIPRPNTGAKPALASTGSTLSQTIRDLEEQQRRIQSALAVLRSLGTPSKLASVRPRQHSRSLRRLRPPQSKVGQQSKAQR